MPRKHIKKEFYEDDDTFSVEMESPTSKKNKPEKSGYIPLETEEKEQKKLKPQYEKEQKKAQRAAEQARKREQEKITKAQAAVDKEEKQKQQEFDKELKEVVSDFKNSIKKLTEAMADELHFQDLYRQSPTTIFGKRSQQEDTAFYMIREYVEDFNWAAGVYANYADKYKDKFKNDKLADTILLFEKNVKYFKEKSIYKPAVPEIEKLLTMIELFKKRMNIEAKRGFERKG